MLVQESFVELDAMDVAGEFPRTSTGFPTRSHK
jgi:hypothetical protein